MLALAIQSRVAAAGTARRRVTGWPTVRPSGSRPLQEGSNRPLPSLVVRPLGSSPLSSKVLSKDRARHPTRVERVHSRARVPLRPRASSSDGQQEGLDISATVVPPMSSVPSQGRQPPEAGARVPAWRALQTDEVTRFRAEGVADDEKGKCCLADLPVPGAAVKSVCPVTAILDSESGISVMSESVAAKLQAAVPDVQIVGPMTDDQYVKMIDGKLVLVRQKSCSMRTALYTQCGNLW